MKYTGHVVMDDTGKKEQTILTEKLRVALEDKYGPGHLTTSVGVDKLDVLKYGYVTNSDETPAPEGEYDKGSGESERPLSSGDFDLDDPATREIEEERDKSDADLEKVREDADNDEEGD